MKKICIIFTSILLIVFSGCSAKTISDNKDTKLYSEKLQLNPLGKTGSGGNFKTLNINVNKNNIPKTQKVYKVKKANVDKNKCTDIAKDLGVTGELKEDSKGMFIRGTDADFIIDKSTGSERYFTKEMRGDIKEQPLKNILSDSEYTNLAKDFLDKHKLSKDGMICKGVNKGYTITKKDETGNEKKDIFRVEVMFVSSGINGVKYTGVGPKISVWFGENGKIVGYASLWREVEDAVEYPTISLDEAVKKVKEGNALIYNTYSLEEEGTIDSCELVLWSDPDGLEQKYVVPHYIMKGKSKDGKDFTLVTRAISEQYITENENKDAIKLPSLEMTQKPN